ncbi:DUF952 domain-containing protein [Candidatus Pelagibacter sp.]|nr:DUF952 domain-containing protein [Candidatus Pelagibacter sp.]
MNLKHIYKIIENDELQKAKLLGKYLGSSKDIQDGYIHFSGQDQIVSTLKKYYSGINNLILLKVETLKLDHLVWEQASDGNFFPHLYSPLDLSSVVNEFEITLDNDGNHKLPDTL